MKRNLFPKTPRSSSPARIEALEKSVDTYGKSIVTYLWRMTGDYPMAEDLAQEVWIKVFKDFDIAAMSNWAFLYRKATQVLIDAMRKKKVRKALLSTEPLAEADKQGYFSQPGTDEEEATFKARFWSEHFPTLELPDQQREAFWLKEHYGYGLVEIAQKLNVPKSTVHEWVNKVKAACRKYLNKEDHEEG